jgi:hypothetical protein
MEKKEINKVPPDRWGTSPYEGKGGGDAPLAVPRI